MVELMNYASNSIFRKKIPCGGFSQIRSHIFGKLYHRANKPPSPRLIARLAVELERFVCDRATPSIIEKLRFEDAQEAKKVSERSSMTRAVSR